MKRFFAFAAALLLLAQSACGKYAKPQTTPTPHEIVDVDAVTAVPTAAPTAVFTDAPTQEPTAVPTQEPTAVPTAVPTAAPVFPTPGRLGNLIGGPLFDEPAKYFVLPGEAGMHYIYNNIGELVDIFIAAESEDIEGARNEVHGFFGELGICYGYSLAKRHMMPDFFEFQGKTFVMSSDWHTLYEIRDSVFENPMRFSGGEERTLWGIIDGEGVEFTADAYSIGECGCAFRLDDRYLIFGGYSHYNENAYETGESWFKVFIDSGVILDDSGRLIEEEVDMKRFGEIKGVFGDRYIVGGNAIYTLEGEKLMEGVELVEKGGWTFSVMDGDGSIRYSYGDYVLDENGNFYDRELNIVRQIEEGSNKAVSPFDRIVLENRVLVSNPVYAGIKDGAGNWLFRIYNPKNAGDSMNSEYYPDWYWEWYWEQHNWD